MNTKVPAAKPRRTRYTVYQALERAGLERKYVKYLSMPAVAKAMAAAATKAIKKAEKAARKKVRTNLEALVVDALNNGK